MFDEHVDTFKVVFDSSRAKTSTLTSNFAMCKSDSLLLQASNLAGAAYIWEDGSRGMERKINRSGVYWVSYELDSLCEDNVDSFIITYPENDNKVSFNIDTLVCENELIKIQNTSSSHYNDFLWSFSDRSFSVLRDPEHHYLHAGSYTVQLIGKINDHCSDTAYQVIIVDNIVLPHFSTDRDSICTGESITFNPVADNNTTILRWQFGDGLESISKEKEEIYHAYDTSGMFRVVLVAQYRACPEQEISRIVYVYSLPIVSLANDIFLCLDGLPVILRNLNPPPVAAHRKLWSTGDTTTNISVVHPGRYSLTVSTAPLGCSTTDSVTIRKDCYTDIPNAFTPNGDGLNDYFFPRQLLSKSVIAFRLQIFNRWGQVVFESNNKEGSGWDGRLNHKEQPSGVYVYLVEIELANGVQERYEGNVTLIR